MSFHKLLIGSLSGLLFVTNAAILHAGLFTAGLTLDGAVDVYRDNSGSFVVDSTGTLVTDPSHVIGTGDIVVGVLRITQVDTKPLTYGATQQLSVLFSAQISGAPVSVTTGAGAELYEIFNLSPVASGVGYSIDELLTSGASQFAPGTFSSNTIFAVLESDPNVANVSLTSFGANLTAFKSAATYTLDLTGGIDNSKPGGLNAAGSTDFFEASLTNFDGVAGITIAELLAQNENDEIGGDSGAFTKIIDNLLLTTLPVSVNDQGYSTGGTPIKSHTSDFGFTANLYRPTADQLALTPPYTIADQTLLKLNVTAIAPEPGSMLIWAGMSLAGACAAYRRRRKVAS